MGFMYLWKRSFIYTKSLYKKNINIFYLNNIKYYQKSLKIIKSLLKIVKSLLN